MADIFDKAEQDTETITEAANEKIPPHIRLSILERDSRSHARALTAVIETLRNQGKTLADIEEWQMKTMMDEVRREEQGKALMLRLDQMETAFKKGIADVKSEVTGLGSVWSRILWIAATPVIAAVAIGVFTLVFGGGVPGA